MGAKVKFAITVGKRGICLSMSKQSNEAKVQNKVAMVEESGYGYAVILNLGGKKQEGEYIMMRHMMILVSGHAHDYGDEDAEVLIFHHLMITKQKPTTRLDDCCLQKNIGYRRIFIRLVAHLVESFAPS